MLDSINRCLRSTIRAQENARRLRDALLTGSDRRVAIEKGMFHLNNLHKTLLDARRKIEESQ